MSKTQTIHAISGLAPHDDKSGRFEPESTFTNQSYHNGGNNHHTTVSMNAVDYWSDTAPKKICSISKNNNTTIEKQCMTCFDCSNGSKPTLPCTLCGVDAYPFDPLPMFRYFVKLLSIPPDATNDEKVSRWSVAFSLLHPYMQKGWGGPQGFQRKIYDPRSPFCPLGRVKQLEITSAQLEPSECRGKISVRIIDRLYATHKYTVYFKRNTEFITWSNSYSGLQFMISGIYHDELIS